MMGRPPGPEPDRIRAMFSAIAGRYDRANTVLSAGIHRRWRTRLVRWSGIQPGQRVLDCATGTGDLALTLARVVGRDGAVVGTDFCPAMLARAPAKARAQGLDIRFVAADVMALPFDRGAFDLASIAFGIRNVVDPVGGLAEMARVVKPGGRVVVLEFGQGDRTGTPAALRFLLPGAAAPGGRLDHRPPEGLRLPGAVVRGHAVRASIPGPDGPDRPGLAMWSIVGSRVGLRIFIGVG